MIIGFIREDIAEYIVTNNTPRIVEDNANRPWEVYDTEGKSYCRLLGSKDEDGEWLTGEFSSPEKARNYVRTMPRYM